MQVQQYIHNKQYKAKMLFHGWHLHRIDNTCLYSTQNTKRHGPFSTPVNTWESSYRLAEPQPNVSTQQTEILTDPAALFRWQDNAWKRKNVTSQKKQSLFFNFEGAHAHTHTPTMNKQTRIHTHRHTWAVMWPQVCETPLNPGPLLGWLWRWSHGLKVPGWPYLPSGHPDYHLSWLQTPG